MRSPHGGDGRDSALRIKPSLVVADALEEPNGSRASPVPAAPAPPPEPRWPTPAPSAPPPSAPERPPPSPPRPKLSDRLRDHLAIGASARLGLGELPSADAGGELEVAYATGGLRVEVHGETAFVQATAPTAASPAYASLRAAGGGGRGCYEPAFGRLALIGCGDLELDWMWAQGHGPLRAKSPDGGWVTLGAGGGARFRLARRFALRALVLGEVPTVRPSFIVENAAGAQAALVHRPSAVWVDAGLGVEAVFF